MSIFFFFFMSRMRRIFPGHRTTSTFFYSSFISIYKTFPKKKFLPLNSYCGSFVTGSLSLRCYTVTEMAAIIAKPVTIVPITERVPAFSCPPEMLLSTGVSSSSSSSSVSPNVSSLQTPLWHVPRPL